MISVLIWVLPPQPCSIPEELSASLKPACLAGDRPCSVTGRLQTACHVRETSRPGCLALAA